MHTPDRIVVSAEWVSNSSFKDSFSLSVQEPSAFVNRLDGCGLTERNFRVTLKKKEKISLISSFSGPYLFFVGLKGYFIVFPG